MSSALHKGRGGRSASLTTAPPRVNLCSGLQARTSNRDPGDAQHLANSAMLEDVRLRQVFCDLNDKLRRMLAR